MKKTKLRIKIGDTVTFDNDQIESFKSETANGNKEIQEYRKLILAGVDQIGVIKDVGMAMATVAYSDGWELPVPIKYLLVLPDIDE